MRESTKIFMGSGLVLLMILLGAASWWPHLRDPYAWPIMLFLGSILLGGLAVLTTMGSLAAREEADQECIAHAQHEQAARVSKRQHEMREALQTRFPGTVASPVGNYDWRILDLKTGQVINEYSGREALAILGLL
jgi:hypothetical protein